MSRIRTIKPEFWANEQVTACRVESRLLFIGLWNFCDDSGVIVDKARQLRSTIFPDDPFSPRDLDGWLDELARAGLIVRYEAEGKRLVWITGWDRHQYIKNKAEKTNGPRPTQDEIQGTIAGLISPVESGNSSPINPNSSPVITRARESRREGKGVEGNGVELRLLHGDASGRAHSSGSRRPPSRYVIEKLPRDWKPDRDQVAYGLSLGLSEAEIARHATVFAGYWTDGNGADERRSPKSWRSTWQRWLLKESERHETRAPPGNATNGTGRRHLTSEEINAAVDEGARRARERRAKEQAS